MDAVLVLLPIMFAILIAVVLQAPGQAVRKQQRRLAALEHKLDLVMAHLGVVEPEPAMPEVVRALEQKHKIAAVKAYRDATGADLAEAKRAVDAMAEQRGL